MSYAIHRNYFRKHYQLDRSDIELKPEQLNFINGQRGDQSGHNQNPAVALFPCPVVSCQVPAAPSGCSTGCWLWLASEGTWGW